MAKEYNFQYTPLTGRLPGNSFVKQTEQAINELAGIVNEGSAQVEVITNLANTANDNAEEALEKANEALETAGRVYITLPNLSDADDYYDSELYYFANSYSANLPVQATGFLEVKTNDTKTACEQVFIADSTGLCYFRHGTITSAEVGSETVYSVTWDIWSSALASEGYVQSELLNYLPLGGGTISGNLSVSGTITGDLTGNADTATNATNDGNGNNIANTYLPKAGGTITGDLTVSGNFTHEETATLLGSSTTVETAVAFGNIANLDYNRYLFTIDIQLSGEDFIRGTAAELSKSALLTNGAHVYNYGSGVEPNWCTLFFIVSPSIGVTYWSGGITNPISTLTSVTFRVYGIK